MEEIERGFKEDWYAAVYPLVDPEIKLGLATNPLDHYLKIGRSRGYLPRPDAARYDDSVAALGAGLWTDQEDALDVLGRRNAEGDISDDEAKAIQQFITDGYAILPGALDADTLASATMALDDAFEGRLAGTRFTLEQEQTDWQEGVLERPAKVLDLHMISASIRDAIMHPDVIGVLQKIFCGPVMASQTLGFWRGSQQPVHQDSAYVTYCDPRAFVGVWTALEDIQPDSGELEYVVGSHRTKPYLFQDIALSVNEVRRLHPDLDMHESVHDQLNFLYAQEKALGLPRQRFLAKQGDVLIWAALLGHGGTKVNQSRTRKSIVTHFCSNTNAPLFFERKPRTVYDYSPSVSYTTNVYEAGFEPR